MKGPEAQFMMGSEEEIEHGSVLLENKVEPNFNDNNSDLNERKKVIHEVIQRLIEKYKNGKRDLDGFSDLVREIEFSSRENDPLQDFAWSQGQVDFISGELNDLTADDSDYSTKLVFDVKNILMHSMGISDSSQTAVSDLFAQSFVNLVKDENVNISRTFEKMIGYMGQDIQMFGSKERYEMVYAMLDNPGKIGEDVRYDFIGGMVLYGSFHDYATYYEFGTLDEKIKIVEVLRFLREVGDDIYNGSSEQINIIIKELEKNEKNYLLKHQYKCVNGKDRYNWDVFRRFNDLSDKNIDSMYFHKLKNDYAREDMRQKTCLSSISDNYGVIYDSSGKIDSFFIVNDQNTGKPERISLKKILEIEGFDTENAEELEKNLTTYKVLLEPIFRKKIEDEFHIKLREFSVRTQMQFLNFLSKSAVDKDNIKLLQSFLSKYQKNGLRSFLSLEKGGQEMGQKILDIGEKYDQETADKIFAKYAQLADYAQDSARYLAKEFNIDDEAKAQEIAEHLLRRGKALLSVCAEENLSSEQVVYKLNNIKAETDIFKESFKLVKSGGEKFSLENINSIQLKIKAGVELLREEKTVKQMKEIYLENYHNFPEEFKQKIIESLDKKLANPQAKFYTLYHNGEIVAFNSFTPQEDGTVHFANFNVDPRYNYAKLGEAMMEVSLDKEAQENTIVAEAIEGLPIAETYLNKKGFQKTGEIELAGVKLINIRKEKSN
jgi:hypothetical protein